LTHALALAAGCWFAWPDTSSPGPATEAVTEKLRIGPATAPRGNSTSSSTTSLASSPREFAAAWELLRREKQPLSERRVLQIAFLKKWSVVDLEAALRAALTEFPQDLLKYQLDPLSGCEPGIVANPDLALQLFRDKTLGLGSSRLRAKWFALIGDHAPERAVAATDLLTGDDQAHAMKFLAWSLSQPDTNAALKEAYLANVSALHDRPDARKAFRAAASMLAETLPLSELQHELKSATDPGKQALFVVALARSLSSSSPLGDVADPFAVEDDPFANSAGSIANAEDPFASGSREDVWKSLPANLRSRIAAEGLRSEISNEGMAFGFTRQVLEDGNLDALKAAAENEGFARFANHTERPAELADWALTLPEDPRTLELYRITMSGAAIRDFEVIREKVLALPSGWQRDQGIAALAGGDYHNEPAAGEIERLLQRIQNPEVQARAKADYAERHGGDGQ
jgi:hypothetical protein